MMKDDCGKMPTRTRLAAPTTPRVLAAGLHAARAGAALSSCAPGEPPAQLRFAVAKFQHETCTFCPGGDTRVEDWLRQSEPLSGEALLASGAYVRGFDETGFAKTIVIVEAPEPFVGTTFLDALPYENVDLTTLYPYGAPPPA